jgi:signal transduction histidine kinase
MPAPRILVVEDEAIVALHLRQQLTKLGYEILAPVASGEQALKEVEASRPDLVLMDIHLEGELDGIATAARIPREYGVPVIYLTAYSEEATLARASATNPYGYLLKPFSERELHAMIQMALARCRAERAEREALACRRQTEKMAALGQLAAGVADDFDHLLTVIYSQLEVLGDAALAHPVLAEPIQEAFGEAIEKEKLIRQLLAFSGRQKLTPDAVSIGQLLGSAANQLRAVLGESIQLQTNLPEDIWTARVDDAQLGKALTLLAANARAAMPDGGTLTIEARNSNFEPDQADAASGVVPGQYVLLTIADTGTGMPDHVLQRAFEPFFSTRPGADGLGLSLVYGFARQSGGHISIDSRPGGGTTIRLWLPVAPDPTPGTPPAAGDRPQDAGQIAAAIHDPDSGPTPLPSPPRLNGDAVPVPWHKAGDALFAFVAAGADNIRHRLIVEPLPRRNGWDWTVWRPDQTDETPRHGRATSVVVAMAAAEAAARQWTTQS